MIYNHNINIGSRDGGTSYHSRKPSTNNKSSTINGNSLHIKKNYPTAPNASYLHSVSNNSPRHKKNLSNSSMFNSYHQNTLQITASRNNRPLEKGSTLDNYS